MRPLRLRIDGVVIDMADAARAHEVEPVLRQALELLAGKLAQVPSAREPEARGEALAVLRLDSMPPEILLGPGGPARLADQLFHQLFGRRGCGHTGAY